MKLKYVFYLFLIQFLFAHSLLAQLFIGGSLGVNALKIVDVGGETREIIISENENTYLHNVSPTIGINSKYIFKKNLVCNFIASYTKKNIKAYEMGFLPIKEFIFDYLQFALAAGYKIQNFEFIGGFEFNRLMNIDKVHYYEYKFIDDISEYGAIVRLSYNYRKFNLGFSYHQGMRFSNKYVQKELFRPLNSMGIDLGYSFKMPDLKINFKKKSPDCPSF